MEDNNLEQILLAQLTMQMRTYDMLTAVLNHLDPVQADAIYEAHEAGRIFTPEIWLAEVPSTD